ncbi:MAG: outer membrane beta-barrel protein [Chlorobi bacterium]|nr:MAG: hypothetical protein UZ07_CHB004003036 [Chlorobi bacterium OLB7]MBK8910418.1 outer membrane beta-barrel protein [Chlorobiota bacterium]MBX7217009.1 outer membrane beta-barrel protein [Candidatus Kapabacteria bacterium]
MIFRYSLSLLMLAAVVLPLQAQEDVLYPYPSKASAYLLGIEVGPNFSLFSQDIALSPIDNRTSPNRALESGNGLGFFGSLMAEVPLTDKIGLQGKVGLDYKRFAMDGSGIADCPDNLQNPFDTVAMDVDQTVSTLYFTSGLFLRFDVANDLFITAGPVLHRWSKSANISTGLEITSPGTCVFTANGQKSIETEATDETSFNESRLGLEAGVGMRFTIGENLWLTPALRFQFMLDPLAPDGIGGVDDFRRNTLGLLNMNFTDRALNALQLGIGVWWKP